MIDDKTPATKLFQLDTRTVGHRRTRVTTPANLKNGLKLGTIRVGVGSGKHFDNEAANGPNVGFASVCRLPHHLGRHPENGALQRHALKALVSALRARREKRRGFDALGDAKVGDFDATFVVDEDVGTLDVTVDDILRVEVGETGQDLSDEVGDEGLAEWTVVDKHCGDGATGDVFEENVQMRVVIVRAEVLHDVGVLELTEQADLMLQCSEHVLLLLDRDLVAAVFGRDLDLLDRHEFSGDGVKGKIHAAETAFADEGALHVSDVVPGWVFEVIGKFLIRLFAVILHELG